MLTLTVGQLAYFDSFAGMLPCRITAITGQSGIASTCQTVTLVLTAQRGAYERGEVITTFGLHAVPRKAYRPIAGRIRPYTLEVK